MAYMVNPETDLWKDLGIEGDDFFELEEAFAHEFKVDMSNYLWYFHHGEEGLGSFGAFFFAPPYALVERIPVTPALLLKAARTKKWPVQYPAHEISSHRYDMVVNRAIGIGLLAAVAAWWLWHALALQAFNRTPRTFPTPCLAVQGRAPVKKGQGPLLVA